jgi:hypothetical protein
VSIKVANIAKQPTKSLMNCQIRGDMWTPPFYELCDKIAL